MLNINNECGLETFFSKEMEMKVEMSILCFLTLTAFQNKIYQNLNSKKMAVLITCFKGVSKEYIRFFIDQYDIVSDKLHESKYGNISFKLSYYVGTMVKFPKMTKIAGVIQKGHSKR